MAWRFGYWDNATLDTGGEDVQHPPILFAAKRSLVPQKKPIQDLAANPSPVQE